MGIYNKLAGYFSRSPIFVEAVRKLFGTRIINDSYIYGQLCKYLAKRYDSQRPNGNLQINIETTLACNAKCLICSKKSSPLTVGRMSDELFLTVIKDAKDIGVKEAILSIYGEPLLDPQFLERAKIVDQANIKFSFFSNGSLLTNALSKDLLSLKNFYRVNFSINGFSKKIYEEIMVGLDREAVYNNVLSFLDLKERIRPDLSVVISCVLFEKNIHEMKQFKKYWQRQKGVESVYFPMIRNRGGTQLDIEAQGESVNFSPLSNKTHKLLPCKFLWEDIFIYWNGDVGVCCEDTAARRIIIGNVANQSLKDIWHGEALRSLRKVHLKGERHLHKVCGKSCTYNTIWLKP